jgi:predicted Zn-dependent protease
VEKQLGGAIDDAALQNYINYVGQKIAEVSHQRGFEYHFTALEDKSMNAMALPGGYIFITRGMLEKLQSEAQLAAILSHETVHVVARHSSAAMSREIGIGVLLSAVTSENTPEAALIAADLARQIIGLRYSRGDERQADIGGLDYMVWAGYNPYAMVETMQILQSQPEDRTPEFFSSHPNPENRIGYLTEKIQTKYYGLTGLKIGKEDYHKQVLERLEK